MKAKADLFGTPNNEQLKYTKCANPDLGVNHAIDGMTIVNCVFKFRNATHVDTVKEYKVWPDNLVQQQGQDNRKVKANSKMLNIANRNEIHLIS